MVSSERIPAKAGWYLGRRIYEQCDMYPVEVVQTPLYLRVVPRTPSQPQHMFTMHGFTWGGEINGPDGLR